MATTTIKDGFQNGSDNQAKVDDTGHLYVTMAGGGVSSNVDIFDSNGNPITATGGALNVNIAGVNPNQNSVLKFMENASVSVGVDTVLVTYTAPAAPTVACLLLVYVGGTNVAAYTIDNSAAGTYDKKYTSAAGLNEEFDFKTGSSIVPGQIIGAGNTITVTVNQIGTSSGDFNARLQVLEIG